MKKSKHKPLTISDALKIAKEYRLTEEVTYCINKLHMTAWEALYEWDLLPYEYMD